MPPTELAFRRSSLGLLAVCAVALAGYYLGTSHHLSGGFFLPLDDAYIYLTYAEQIARGAPFSYFDGSGYSAGATSPLWPWLLAPLWAMGMRGDAFALGSSLLGTVLYAGVLVVAHRLTWRLALAHAPEIAPRSSLIAPALVCASGPLAWGCLSGMEVGLVAFLFLATATLLFRRPDEALGRQGPDRALGTALAALALSRPEAGCVVVLLCAGGALRALLGRRSGVLFGWAAPVMPLAGFAIANRLAAGHFAPNTAIAKSAFYLPGFTWASDMERALTRAGEFYRVLFSRWDGSLGLGPLIGLLAVVGTFALLGSSALRSRRTACWFLILAAPLYVCAVLLSSGAWAFQHQRYVSCVYPLPIVLASAGALFLVRSLGARAGAAILAAVAVAATARAVPRHRDEALLFAQGARDVRDQVVRVGRFVDAALPTGARLAIHDAGAMGYYGHRPLFDVVGLVTNGQAEWCNQGPGARFESLERIPRARRPTHFAYYPGWLLAGAPDLFGPVLLEAPLSSPLALPDDVKPRLVGGASMFVMQARWELAGSGDRPMSSPDHPWRIVDVLDVADLASEAEHGYVGDLGEVGVGARNEHFSVYYRAAESVGTDGREPHREIADGGRTILGASGERFVLRTPRAGRLRIVLRSGGPASLPLSDIGKDARSLELRDSSGRALGTFEVPAPDSHFAEVTIELPADRADVTRFVVKSRAPGQPYRSFHYFLLEGP